jgi:signal transduction histidine kinase
MISDPRPTATEATQDYKPSGRFIHDVKNLLTVVLGYSEMLLDELGQDDPHRADVLEIHKAGRRALELVTSVSKSGA